MPDERTPARARDDNASKSDQQGIDKAVRTWASELKTFYERKASQGGAYPDRIKNAVNEFSAGGYEAVRKALKAGVALPAGLLAAIGLSQAGSDESGH